MQQQGLIDVLFKNTGISNQWLPIHYEAHSQGSDHMFCLQSLLLHVENLTQIALKRLIAYISRAACA